MLVRIIWIPHALLVEMYDSIASMKNNVSVSQKFTHSIIIWYSNSASGFILKRIKIGTWTNVYAPVFIAALLTVTKWLKQFKCPSTGEWIYKMWYIHTM